MPPLRICALTLGFGLAWIATTGGCEGVLGGPSPPGGTTSTGATGTGGSGAVTGTGGTAAAGGSGAAAQGGGGSAPVPVEFSFFVLGDPRSGWDAMEDNARSMVTLDPEAIAVFAPGDLTPTGARGEWDDHHDALAQGAPDPSVPADPTGIVRQSHFRTDVTTWGPYTRYLGIMGNHDDGSDGWHSNWNDYLPGQVGLGQNSPDGIYYSLSYENVLFIALDSINRSDEQTAWLEQVLQSPEAAAATFKIAFFHYPVYPCNYKSPFGGGIPWVELFEQHGLDIAFVADSHTYERSCPMIGGSCAAGGVIYLNSSGGGAGTRVVDATKTDTVGSGDRTDSYDCAEILDQYQGEWHHFTHVAIEDCTLTASTYAHDWHATQEAAFDTLVLDRCGG